MTKWKIESKDKEAKEEWAKLSKKIKIEGVAEKEIEIDDKSFLPFLNTLYPIFAIVAINLATRSIVLPAPKPKEKCKRCKGTGIEP